MRELRGEEAWVKACIEAALHGVEARQHDDGTRDRMHDFDLWRSGERFGALEVTAAADSESIELWRLMNRRDTRWIEPGLAGGWAVVLSPQARARTLKRELPEFLARLEERGIRELTAGRRGDPAMSRWAEQMQVHLAFQSGTEHPGSIYVTIDLPPEKSGGGVAEHGDALAAWLSSWLAQPDQLHNVDKLSGSGEGERHLFVLFPGFTIAPFPVVDLLMRSDAPLPGIAPELPHGLTHVWAMSTWTSGSGFLWSAETAWEQFAKVFEVPAS